MIKRLQVVMGLCVGWTAAWSQSGASPAGVILQRGSVDTHGSAMFVRVDDGPLYFSPQRFARDWTADANEQTRQALEALAEDLKQQGSGLAQVVRLQVYLAREEDGPAVESVLTARLAAFPPAITWVATPLPVPGARVALDVVATVAALPAPARTVWTETGGALLPAGAKVFISGQAERGEGLVDSVRRTMDSLHRTTAGLGLAPSDVVQVKAFLRPFDDHAAAREAIAAGFAGPRLPAVVLMEWVANLPVEIELVVAGRGLKTPPGEGVSFATLPGKPSSPRFSHVAIVSAGTPLLFLGGIDAGPGDIAPREQWKRIFERLGGTLLESGSSFRHLVKATYFLEETPARAVLNEIRAVYYDPARPPAASAVGVESVGRPGRSFHMDLIAVPRPMPE